MVSDGIKNIFISYSKKSVSKKGMVANMIEMKKKRIENIVIIVVMLIGIISFGRENKVKAASQAEEVVNYALSQVGNKERSGNDDIKYNDWYYNRSVTNSRRGQYSWCHVFVSYCANQCGISTSIIPKEANCQRGVEFFKKNGRYHTRASEYTPKVGDIIYLSTDGTSTAHHVGIVYAVDDTNVYYVDGNNTKKSPHRVAKSERARDAKDVLGYGNPAYDSVSMPSSATASIPFPSIHSVNIHGIDSTTINFSFSVSNGTLAKIVIESTLTGETITKSYTSGLSNISYSFNRIDMPTGGNQYHIYLYAYSGSANNYGNEQIHKMTYGSTMQCVTFPNTLDNDQVKAITFNYKFYADLNEDLKNIYGYDEAALYKHWLRYGVKEGRIGDPGFSSSFYLKYNGDLSKAYGSNDYAKAYFHYITWGYNEERISAPVFSAKYYLDKNKDVANTFGNNNLFKAAVHFNANAGGMDEFRDSSQFYYGNYYKDNNGDLSTMTSYQLLLHYYKYGIEEKRYANVDGEIPTV